MAYDNCCGLMGKVIPNHRGIGVPMNVMFKMMGNSLLRSLNTELCLKEYPRSVDPTLQRTGRALLEERSLGLELRTA